MKTQKACEHQDYHNARRIKEEFFWDLGSSQLLYKHHHDQKTMTKDRYMEY